MQKILIIEDDRSIAELEKDYLEMSGFLVECAYDGPTGERLLRDGHFDLVLLDLMLPGKDGYTILRGIAEEKTIPILIVSAKDEELYKIKGLNLGADDYIGKPFRPRELVSRIRSVLRRCGKAQNIIELGDVTIDTAGGTVRKEGQELFLSALEYRLLLVFANHKGNVLSRNQLLEEIWDVAGEFVNDNTLTVYIKRLREKIETDAANPTIIKTVRGLGYRAE